VKTRPITMWRRRTTGLDLTRERLQHNIISRNEYHYNDGNDSDDKIKWLILMLVQMHI